jgi:hypothetical protein
LALSPSFDQLDVELELELLSLDNTDFDPDDVRDGLEEFDNEPDSDDFDELEEEELLVSFFL